MDGTRELLSVTEVASAPGPQTVTTAQVDSERSLGAIRVSLILIAVIHTLAAFYLAKEIVMPVVMGFLIALTFSPVVRAGMRRGIPAPLTAVALIITLGASVATGVYTTSDTISSWIDQAPQLGAQLQEKLEGVSRSVEVVKKAAEDVEDAANSATGGSVTPEVKVQQPGLLASALNGITSAGSSLAIALVFAMFLLSSGQLFYVKLVQTFASMEDKKSALRIVRDIEQMISRYLLTIASINFGLGACIGVAAYIIGMPYAAAWGLIAFCLNFLPFIGSLVGTALIGAMSVVTFDSLPYALLAPAAYLALSTLEGQFVTPAILGRRLEINTVSVFLMVMFWAWLWGVAGALMAVPILVVAKVTFDNVTSLRPWGAFLGGSTRI